MQIYKHSPEYQELVDSFTCGNIVIDRFLKSGDALDKNQGITYLLLSDEKDFIIGYYNIEAGRIEQVEQVGADVVYSPMGGAININYLAIHSDFQHTKIAEVDGQNIYLGDYLLRDCEKKILELRREVGIAFVTLSSTEAGKNLYYNRNCYEYFEDDMSMHVRESDKGAYHMYKCVDDIV